MLSGNGPRTHIYPKPSSHVNPSRTGDVNIPISGGAECKQGTIQLIDLNPRPLGH